MKANSWFRIAWLNRNSAHHQGTDWPRSGRQWRLSLSAASFVIIQNNWVGCWTTIIVWLIYWNEIIYFSRIIIEHSAKFSIDINRREQEATETDCQTRWQYIVVNVSTWISPQLTANHLTVHVWIQTNWIQELLAEKSFISLIDAINLW